jgi:lipopolysaccharide transport system ATP-binding protein
MHQLSTNNQKPAMPLENEVLVRVSGVSKKFCRDLKKSLWYGVKDVASELLPFGSGKVASSKLPVDGENFSTNNSQLSTKNHSPVLRPGEFWANKDISFELRRGECLGLIGHNGAGKTTLLKMLNGLIKPDSGTIEMRGRVGALIALGAGFNPILTGRENIYVNGSILGLSKQEIDAKIEEIIDFAEIRDFIDTPVQSYSSGMQVRLGFSIASSLDPDILILDEVLAVGDNAFKVKCLTRIFDLQRNCATIFVSHEAFQVSKICSRVLWLDHGLTLKESRDVNGILSDYELMGINRALESSSENNPLNPKGFTLKLNGNEVSHDKYLTINARDPFKMELNFPPIVIDKKIESCEIIMSIIDSGGSPVASIRNTRTGRYYSIDSQKFREGYSVAVALPEVPLADGPYHIRISIVAAKTEDFLFYAEHAASIRLSDFGHGWYKTILCAEWGYI